MLRVLIYFWLILFTGFVYAYPTDSLISQFSKKQDSNEITDTYLLDELYKKCNSLKETHFLFDEIKNRISEKSQLLNVISYARRLEFFGEHTDAIEQIETIRSKRFEALPNNIKAEYYHCLGYISINSEDPESAFKYYNLGYRFAQKTDNLELKQSLLSACGVALNALGEHEKAMNFFNSSLDLEVKGINRNSLKTRLNIALTKSNLGDLEVAKSIFLESLELLREQADYTSEIRLLGNLADIYLEQDSLNQAEDYYLLAKDLALEKHQHLDLIRIDYYLSRVYKKKGDFQNAYHFLYLSDSISSLYNANNKVSNQLSEIETENEIKLREDLLSLQIEKESIEKRNKWIVITICVLLIIALLVVLNYAMKLKNKNQLLLRHEVKNTKKPENSAEIYNRHKELIEKFTKLSKSELIKDANLNLDKLAKKLGTNRTYLSEVLNDQFQLSFSQWINQERVNVAKEMLISEDNDKFSIEAIAFSVGFSSTSTFNQQFKTITGLTPSYFRKNRLK